MGTKTLVAKKSNYDGTKTLMLVAIKYTHRNHQIYQIH